MSRYRGVNLEDVKKQNRITVLEILYWEEPISRTRIAKLCKLTKPTISSIISEFEKAGLVDVVGEQSKGVGRKEKLLGIRKDAAFIIGVDLGRDKTSVSVFNLRGESLFKMSCKTPTPDGPAKVLSILVSAIKEAIFASGVSREKVKAVGIGIPGSVDFEKGTVSPPHFHGWKDVPLARMLEEEIKLPVWVDNDANVAALGEMWFGIRGKFSNFVFVLVAIGLGAGIVLSKKLYRGTRGLAGEIGHALFPDEKDGWITYEDVASGRAIINLGKQYGKDYENIEEFVSDVFAGDEKAREIAKIVGRSLGAVITTIVNFLNPEAIILGGRVSKLGETLLKEVKRVVKEKAFAGQMPEILWSTFGDDAILMGAAALALEGVFSRPEILLS